MQGRETDPEAGVQPVPLTVIAGHPGAGKTTVLVHLLRHARRHRIAVLVHGSAGTALDALARRRTASCIRCESVGAVAKALAGLRGRAGRLEHVFVEASGTTAAELVAHYGSLPGYVLDGILDIADAEAIHYQACAPLIGPRVMGQLSRADLIVLNKTDLLSPEEREGVVDWLGEAIPEGRVVECSYGRLPPTLLLGGTPAADVRLARRRARDARAVARYPQEVGYSAWAWSAGEPLDEAGFRWWAGTLPQGIVRGSGVLHLRGEPETRFVFDLIGPRWTLRRERPWGQQRPHTLLSLLGRAGSFDPRLLEMKIGQCRTVRSG